MKFEEKFPDAQRGEKFDYQTTVLIKGSLGECDACRSFTRWMDVKLNKVACSEECCVALWQQQLADSPEAAQEQNRMNFEEQIRQELAVATNYSVNCPSKDILIVVRDQLDYFKACVESIQEHTNNYKLYIWDNASKDETKFYIERLLLNHPDEVEIMRSEFNLGFIHPNNEMASWGKSEYIILLNSDTKVFEGWDAAMVGHLKEQSELGVVGYLGGLLGEDGMGVGSAYGYDIDYVMGWCLCVARSTYEQHGLFSKQLTFAYCEDADLSLRLREAGLFPYAIHAPLVHHYGNKTIKQVSEEKEMDVKKSFDLNHTYMRFRWGDYLKTDRVLRKGV